MKRTYITLFSCAGVGCYGFKMNDFECVASNELLEPRIMVQRANKKCRYESGYICGDATAAETHQKIFDEIQMWKEKEGLQQVDVVFATPPCQGMSTANYKKTDHEQVRNSLVVEAIKIIKEIHPKVFVFENVRAFMKSICTNVSGEDMLIKDSIYKNLSGEYNIYWKVINFKDYGVPSSRPRTIVIGTSKALIHTTPLNLFPTRKVEILLKDSIGKFPRLDYCQKDAKDPLHFARPFPEYMLAWIKDLKEGETAFDNPDEIKPYQLDNDGNKVVNKGAYMGNKYRRLIWDRPGACIATRSDIMSSQDTIHPTDNRVLSIRELMTLMTIPNSFKWTENDDELTVDNSDVYLKENEGNIRRCIGEAVPTHIGYTIANKISKMLDYEDYISGKSVEKTGNYYISSNAELSEKKCLQSAFEEMMKMNADITSVNVLIKSMADAVVYVPMLSSYYSHIEKLNIEIVGLDADSIEKLNQYLILLQVGSNVHVGMPQDNQRMYYHHLIIDNGVIRVISSVGKKTVKKKDTDTDQLQLSLF